MAAMSRAVARRSAWQAADEREPEERALRDRRERLRDEQVEPALFRFGNIGGSTSHTTG